MAIVNESYKIHFQLSITEVFACTRHRVSDWVKKNSSTLSNRLTDKDWRSNDSATGFYTKSHRNSWAKAAGRLGNHYQRKQWPPFCCLTFWKQPLNCCAAPLSYIVAISHIPRSVFFISFFIVRVKQIKRGLIPIVFIACDSLLSVYSPSLILLILAEPFVPFPSRKPECCLSAIWPWPVPFRLYQETIGRSRTLPVKSFKLNTLKLKTCPYISF